MKRPAKTRWQVQEAKTHLSELIEKADKAGPQVITKHGKERAAVISIDDLKELQSAKEKKPRDFKEWLFTGPVLDDETIAVINDRSNDPGRDVSHLFEY